jgi:chaperonin GroES
MSAASPSTIEERTTTLQPLDDRIVARVVARDEMTAGGIMLPDTVKGSPTRATVIAVGPGRLTDEGTRSPIDVQAGDEILFARYGGVEVTLDGDELLILAEKDILAVVTT